VVKMSGGGQRRVVGGGFVGRRTKGAGSEIATSQN
jgi:hypothetical protein